MKGTRVAFPFLILLFLLCGFILTRSGMDTWDSAFHLDQSRWLIGSYLGKPLEELSARVTYVRWYGPLWELILGVFTEIIFPFLRDPTWVRYSATFALYPTTLYLLAVFLLENGVKPGTTALTCALLFSDIRLTGHSVLNTKDFPFACAYLLCTLYLWRKTQDLLQGKASWRLIATGTIISLIPYLMRTPVLIHFLAWLIIVWLYLFLFSGKTRTLVEKTSLALLPFPVGALLLWCLWPSLWDGWSNWLKSFLLMAKFEWQGEVRLLGLIYQQDHVPSWYPIAWLPIIFHPFGFLVLLVGLGSLCRRTVLRLKRHFPSLSRMSLSELPRFMEQFLDLEIWILLFVLVAFLGLWITKPIIYDEDRHLLFMYPPIAVLCGLALDWLKEKTKWWISAILVLFSFVSFFQWGRYSYVYKNPIVGNIAADHFMGDYWGICVPKGILALEQYVPKGAIVQVPDVMNIAQLQYFRLIQGSLTQVPGFGPFQLVYRTEQPGIKSPHYVLMYNRMGMDSDVQKDIREGRARKIWEDMMPPGDPACTLAFYPN